MNINCTKLILIFDGDCLMCNQFIQFVIKYDQSKTIYFTSLHSVEGQKLTNQLELVPTEIDSIVFITPTKYFLYSDAILKILQQMGGSWKNIGRAFIHTPKRWRDYIYRRIAKQRYKFGKHNKCMLPSLEIKKRFL